MPSFSRLAVLLGSFGLAACATTGEMATRPQVPCPVAGTRVVMVGGGEFTYAGRDPADPEICLVAGLRLFENIAPDPTPEQRTRLRALVPFEVGKQASFEAARPDAAWRETYRITDRRRIIVGAGIFDAWEVEYTVEGTAGSSFFARLVVYIDATTGVALARRTLQNNSLEASWPRDFEAARVIPPT